MQLRLAGARNFLTSITPTAIMMTPIITKVNLAIINSSSLPQISELTEIAVAVPHSTLYPGTVIADGEGVHHSLDCARE